MDEFDPSSPINQKLDYLIRTVDGQQKMIKALHSAMVWSKVIQFFYWFLIIGVTIGSFYFLQPYLEKLLSVYGQVSDVGSDLGSIQDSLLPR